MYLVYYDSGTTNTRAYLIKDSRIVDRKERKIGARDAALAGDNTVLIEALYQMYQTLLEEEGIAEADVERILLSGMISCPTGMVEVEHLPAPVDRERLRGAIVPYEENKFFKRTVEIVPGIKTLGYGEKAAPEDARRVNIMRGEEIEIFGILRNHPELAKGKTILVLPGSHTQVAFINDGCVEGISSNVTGELFGAITKETILGASVAGDEAWEMDPDMICLGYKNVRTYGFNRALYILRVLDLFTEADINGRRSYFEGVLNAGVMDAIKEAQGEEPGTLAVTGGEIQFAIYKAFCENLFPQFEAVQIEEEDGVPFSVSGVLNLLQQ